MLTTFWLLAVLIHAVFGFALGYFVLVVALKQEDWLRKAGFFLGWLIIVISLLFTLIGSIQGVKAKEHFQEHMNWKKEKMMKKYENNEEDESNLSDEAEDRESSGFACPVPRMDEVE